jgi:hypothetical protein
MLKGMHNFSIETQTQYHAPLAIDTHKAPDGGIVKADQLKAFINAAEWNLAATGSRDPTLHFIAYLPTPDLRPLRSIHDNGKLAVAFQHALIRTGLFSNEVAFTVPQFGSVYVLNHPAEASPQDALPQAFAVFRDQLEVLLGLPRPPAHLDMSADDRVAWQRRMLMQRQVVGNAREAVETLQAIIKLKREQGNLRINGEVQGFVLRSLAALDRVRALRSIEESTEEMAVQARTRSAHPAATRGGSLPLRLKGLLPSVHVGTALLPARAQVRRLHAPLRTHRHPASGHVGARVLQVVEGAAAGEDGVTRAIIARVCRGKASLE